MKLAIMQPYFFPYIGYFQLISSVDKFVVYDDVNFIRGGWIARNRYIVNGRVSYFSVPLSGASPFAGINETSINREEYRRWRGKFFKSLHQSYGKAPYFDNTIPVIEQVCNQDVDGIHLLAVKSLELVCRYLGISTPFAVSSATYGNSTLKGVERILDICLKENATTYRNAIGGRELYSERVFAEKGISLQFIKSLAVPYEQFGGGFSPSLSIIDVMMFNSRDKIREMLQAFEVI